MIHMDSIRSAHDVHMNVRCIRGKWDDSNVIHMTGDREKWYAIFYKWNEPFPVHMTQELSNFP